MHEAARMLKSVRGNWPAQSATLQPANLAVKKCAVHDRAQGAPAAGRCCHGTLAANVQFAEAHYDVTVRGGSAEAELRTEAREHHDLIELPSHGSVVGTVKNAVAHGLAILVHRGLH